MREEQNNSVPVFAHAPVQDEKAPDILVIRYDGKLKAA